MRSDSGGDSNHEIVFFNPYQVHMLGQALAIDQFSAYSFTSQNGERPFSDTKWVAFGIPFLELKDSWSNIPPISLPALLT
jgi:hypothetical protein